MIKGIDPQDLNLCLASTKLQRESAVLRTPLYSLAPVYRSIMTHVIPPPFTKFQNNKLSQILGIDSSEQLEVNRYNELAHFSN